MKLAIATIIALTIPLTARADDVADYQAVCNQERTIIADTYGEPVAKLCDAVQSIGGKLIKLSGDKEERIVKLEKQLRRARRQCRSHR